MRLDGIKAVSLFTWVDGPDVLWLIEKLAAFSDMEQL
jgi:hypothetical protein